MTGLPEIQAGPIHFEHLQYKGFSFENKCQSYKIEMRRYRHIWLFDGSLFRQADDGGILGCMWIILLSGERKSRFLSRLFAFDFAGHQ